MGRARPSLACVVPLGVALIAPPAAGESARVPASGLRRLTAHEYDNTLRDLLGDHSRPGRHLLPPDRRGPFDNDTAGQVPSKALVEALDLLARDAVERLLRDRARRDAVVGCAPKQARDRACFGKFLATFGRRALRRPLTGEELTRYQGLLRFAGGPRGFYGAVQVALHAFLQHGEVIYRAEVGTPVPDEPGTFALGAFEIATRLAYFLWASPPDAALLDLAAAGKLRTADGVRRAAARMLDDARAREVVVRFHALWMDYEDLRLAADLGRAMQEETSALIRRVVFEERRPWQDLLRWGETFVSDGLAAHYGLSVPGSAAPVWIPYAGSGRKGILSHGTFLSAGGKFSGDTSPTRRGLLIRERLLCQDVPPPPPGVDSNKPPPITPEAECKEDRYHVHKEGGCGKCHRQIDPVGFGLERFDRQGRFRTHEPKKPQCAIRASGELLGVGEFSGPAGLADALLASGRLNECLVTQVFRYAMGRYQLDETDRKVVAHLTETLGGPSAEWAFQDLLLALVSADAFRHRREDAASDK